MIFDKKETKKVELESRPVGEVEVVGLEVVCDGGLGLDLGNLSVVSQNQSGQNHVLDDWVKKEVWICVRKRILQQTRIKVCVSCF